MMAKTTMSQLKAVIFGAIGSITETSDLQRQAFNTAFQTAGLDWHWDLHTYRDLVKINGGQNRLRAYRDAIYANVTDATITELHQAKTAAYVAMLDGTSVRETLTPRAGVVELINTCNDNEIQVALCTSTDLANVEGLRSALARSLSFDRFATIVTIDKINQPKPAPDAYLYCLQQLGVNADQVIAIEDTPVSLAAAKAAKIQTIATPGATTSDQDFAAADLVLPNLTGITLDRLSALLNSQIPAYAS